ncbi:MAG: hypothetical protein WAK20_17645 [Candidatus Acidiferrum sp.]
MSLIADERGCADQLAKFFPDLPATRVMVRVQSIRSARGRLQESTVIEFGAGQFAIFTTTLPLEFDERIQLVRHNKAMPVEAAVIAVQYHEGMKAVAVRFLEGTWDWKIEP